MTTVENENENTRVCDLCDPDDTLEESRKSYSRQKSQQSAWLTTPRFQKDEYPDTNCALYHGNSFPSALVETKAEVLQNHVITHGVSTSISDNCKLPEIEIWRLRYLGVHDTVPHVSSRFIAIASVTRRWNAQEPCER